MRSLKTINNGRSNLRSTHLTVFLKTFKVFTCLETGALNFSFRRNAFPLAPFSSYTALTIYIWCLPHCRHWPLQSVLVWPPRGKTYLTNCQSNRSSRSNRSVQAKQKKVKSVKTRRQNRNPCRSMHVTSNLSDLISLSEWQKRRK